MILSPEQISPIHTTTISNDVAWGQNIIWPKGGFTLIAGRKMIITSCEFAILQHRKRRQSNCIIINNIMAHYGHYICIDDDDDDDDDDEDDEDDDENDDDDDTTTMTTAITMMLVQNIKHPACNLHRKLHPNQHPKLSPIKSSSNHLMLPSELSIFHPMTCLSSSFPTPHLGCIEAMYPSPLLG